MNGKHAGEETVMSHNKSKDLRGIVNLHTLKSMSRNNYKCQKNG